MQNCTLSACFVSKPCILHKPEGANHKRPCARFFSSRSRKMLRLKGKMRVKRKKRGRAANMAWVTGRRCTREQFALPQSRRPNRIVSVLVSTKRKRTGSRFALLVSGVLSQRDGSHSAFFLAANLGSWVFKSKKRDINIFEGAEILLYRTTGFLSRKSANA